MELPKFKADYIGWAIGLIAIIIAIWTYHASKLAPDLSYSVDPNRAILVNADSNAIADFTIQYKGATISRNNVSAVTIYFWNAGNAPTHRAQILSPIRIVLPPGAEVFDASLVRESRGICGIQLRRPGQANQYEISFDILEPKDGAAIQVIYSGAPDAPVTVSGLIEGQNAIHQVFPGKLTKEESNNPLLALRHGKWALPAACILFVLGVSINFFGVILTSRRPQKTKDVAELRPSVLGRWALDPIYAAVMIFGAILMIVGLFGSFSGIPPSIAVGR